MMDRTRKRKWLLVVAGALVGMLAVVGMSSALIRVLDGEPAPTDAPVGKDATQPERHADGDQSEGRTDEAGIDEIQIGFDDTGMAMMPVTSEPAEAAAGAAAVLWSTDFTKLTRAEYFDAAIERITRPTDSYIGPQQEIHTYWFYDSFKPSTNKLGYTDPAELFADAVHTCGLQPDTAPCRWWWNTPKGTFYDSARADGQASRATPLVVVSEAEMLEWAPRNELFQMKDRDLEPDTPGASLSHWWVLSEVMWGWSEQGVLDQRVVQGSQISIWCDAPADGGICGVVELRPDARMPEIWPGQ